MNIYKIEITDTFGGEANYSWVRRYLVKAKSELGAVNVIAKNHGAGWRKDYPGRYNLKGAAVCMFVDWIAEDDAREYVEKVSRVEKINY